MPMPRPSGAPRTSTAGKPPVTPAPARSEEPDALRLRAGESKSARFSFVESASRTLAVINAFDADHARLTLSDLSRRTGINRAAARRFVLTLAELGYLRNEGKHFVLTSKVLNLGYAFLSSLALPELSIPHLRTLSETVKESSYLSVLDDDVSVCVASVPMRRLWSIALNVGIRLPALTTASGRVLLASKPDPWLTEFLESKHVEQLTSHTIVDHDALRRELDVVRDQGWALVDREYEDHVCSFAAPVTNQRGEVVAAVSVSKLRDESDISDTLTHLLTAAGAISNDVQKRFA
jgi:IclR family transcriptional regulator, pca regulon regulatory protein